MRSLTTDDARFDALIRELNSRSRRRFLSMVSGVALGVLAPLLGLDDVEARKERRNKKKNRAKKRRRQSVPPPPPAPLKAPPPPPPPPPCVGDCAGKDCGNDGCGGSCGICASGESCQSGVCGCATPCTTSSCGSIPAGCSLLPADNIWNASVDALPLDPRSAAYVGSIGMDAGLHPDFGSGLFDGRPIGIPFVSVPSTQPGVPVQFVYDDESDPGPYPIPHDAPIEGGSCSTGDRHVLIVQAETCLLYELYDATPQGDGWSAGSGAIFDLRSNALRPAGWTSADAAGLPVLVGLVRFEEVAAGVIPHALRFTVTRTRNTFLWPARHEASAEDDAGLPPMGQRFRLKASVDVSGFSATNQVILTALKTYGMLLADNGSNWFLSGAPDPGWDNDDLHELRERIHGRDFEAVDCSSLMVDPNSGQVG